MTPAISIESTGILLVTNEAITTTSSSRKQRAQAFADVIDEFKSEVEFGVKLTLGLDMFNIGVTDAGHTIVVNGLWKNAQMKMTQHRKKTGYDCVHRIMEFDLNVLPCIVSEECAGDLLHLPAVKPEQIIPVWKHLMHQIWLGLRFMHGENIAHNDIKPANIFYNRVSTGGLFQAIVADFGMCTPANDLKHIDFGTQAYACPELEHAFDKKEVKQTPSKTRKNISEKKVRVPDTVPKYNDAFTFAKSGLVLLLKLKFPDHDEHALLKIVNGVLASSSPERAPSNADNVYDNDALAQHLLSICKHPSPAERYALFETTPSKI